MWTFSSSRNLTSTKITFSLMDTNYKYSTFKQILDLRSILPSISFVSITHTTLRSNRGPIFWGRSRDSFFSEDRHKLAYIIRVYMIYASSPFFDDGYMRNGRSLDKMGIPYSAVQGIAISLQKYFHVTLPILVENG